MPENIFYVHLQARSQDFCWGGGGGGGVRISGPSASPKGGGVCGYAPPGKFEKMGYLRLHFMRFEDSLLGNKPYKAEGSKDNNSVTFFN